MDRQLSTRKKKRQLFKEFEWMDLIPYSIALLMVAAELSILCQFIRLYTKLAY